MQICIPDDIFADEPANISLVDSAVVNGADQTPDPASQGRTIFDLDTDRGGPWRVYLGR